MPARCRLRAPKAASPRPLKIHAARSRSGGRHDPAGMRIGAHVGERCGAVAADGGGAGLTPDFPLIVILLSSGRWTLELQIAWDHS